MKTDLVKITKDLEAYKDQVVTVGGWVRSTRDSKTFGFIDLNDGTTFKGAQIVVNNTLSNFDQVVKLNTGSSIIVTGKLILTPENKQPYEIVADNIEVCSATDETYPIQKKRQTVEFLRENAYLRGRTNLFNAVFRVRNACAFAIHSFFQGENFMYVHTPIITCADCEGGSDVFRVTTHNFYDAEEMKTATPETDFFGKNVFLCPTGQLEAEAFALAFSKVYTFGPTFRSENSNTARHASEFWMIEPEMAFFDLDDDMDIAEEFVKYLLNWALTKCRSDLEFFDKRIQPGLIDMLSHVIESPFKRVSYTEAIAELEKHADKFEYKPYWGCDLQTEHERFLTEQIFKCPVMLYNYPKEIKAFYMKLNDDGKTVAAVDLVVPQAGELMGGSQREENLEKLLERMEEMHVAKEGIEWYLDTRRYGGCVHSGFGMGFERLIMYLTGVDNIRDVIPYPRTPKNCEF